MQKMKVGIIGATGMVGQRFLTLLDGHPYFEVTALAASARSAGKTYREAVGERWKLDIPCPAQFMDMTIIDAANIDEMKALCDFVFCAVDMKKEDIRALEEAYANQKMVGKFPGCVLHLTIRTNEVDVNVHPTKTEVKFRSEQQVFTTVYHAVLAALTTDRSRPQAVLPNVKKEDTVTPHQTALTMNDFTAPKAAPKPVSKPAAPVRPVTAPAQPPKSEGFTFRRAEVLPKAEPKKAPAKKATTRKAPAKKAPAKKAKPPKE